MTNLTNVTREAGQAAAPGISWKDKQMFCALLGGKGLRAGEAIGLEIDQHVSENFRTLYIRQKVRRTKLELFLKTDAGGRDVDLSSALAVLLEAYEKCHCVLLRVQHLL